MSKNTKKVNAARKWSSKAKLRVALTPFALGALALPAVGGCDTIADAQGAVCCSEFQVGATINADIGGSAQSVVAVQAVADFAGIAGAAVDDLTGACRNIAQDLDAPKADQDAAEAKTDKRDKMEAWCGLAVSTIGTVKASLGGSASIDLQVTPPVCEASVSAKANCQASCSAEGTCDIKANPPKCTGGSLEVACKGGCTGTAGAAVKCEGSCTAECSGECTAEGGVECAGRCDGNCKASAMGSGTGIQADGTCDGVCEGTCAVTAPSATCSGTCKGTCSATCQGTAEVSVKCDGECDADFEPLKCEGGKLEGGCTVDAKCDANCDASVSAKASCTPPAVNIVISGTAMGSVEAMAAGKLVASLEANLGVVYAFKARLEGMGQVVGTISGNIDAVVDIKAACIPAMAAAIATGIEDVAAAGDATVSIVGSIGG